MTRLESDPFRWSTHARLFQLCVSDDPFRHPAYMCVMHFQSPYDSLVMYLCSRERYTLSTSTCIKIMLGQDSLALQESLSCSIRRIVYRSITVHLQLGGAGLGRSRRHTGLRPLFIYQQSDSPRICCNDLWTLPNKSVT